MLVGCCIATKCLTLNGMEGGDNGCGIGFLRVTSNKLVTFPRQNSIRPSGLALFPGLPFFVLLFARSHGSGKARKMGKAFSHPSHE